MPRRASILFAAMAVLAACGDSGTDLPDVDRVVVSPDETALVALGATTDFTAQALDVAGAPITGVEFDWSSTDESVATVDDNGRAIAMGEGEAFIRASVAGVTGEARLVVRQCGGSLQLAPGQWTSVDVPGQDECGFILPSGSAGDLYRVGVIRTGSSATASDVANVSVQVRAVEATTAAPPRVAAPFDAPAGPRLRLTETERAAARLADETLRFHLALREREARMLELIGTDGVLPSRAPSAVQRQAGIDAPQRIMIDPTTPTTCSPAGTATPAFKVAENDDLAIYQDSAQASVAANAITVEQAQQMLDYYSAHGKPIVDDYFGGVSDIDGNGKILLVAHPTVSSTTAAFVWSGDFFAKSDCPASNEAELIFFSASLIRGLDTGNYQALETVTHEAKHVSSLYKSIIRGRRGVGSQAYHPGWIEEGSAEIAGNMSARRGWSTVGGPAPHARVTADIIRSTGADADRNLLPEFYGVAIRLSRVQGYLASQPNAVVVNPLGADTDHSIYGSGWTFLRWLADAYGGAGTAPYADADFFREQNDSTSVAGVAGLQDLVGKAFAELLLEYTVAVMLNGTSAPAPTRAFTGYDFVSAIELFCFAADNPPCDGEAAGPAGTFPWPVTAQSDGIMFRPFVDDTYAGSSGVTGMRIHELRSTGTGSAEVVVEAPNGARVIVARIE